MRKRLAAVVVLLAAALLLLPPRFRQVQDGFGWGTPGLGRLFGGRGSSLDLVGGGEHARDTAHVEKRRHRRGTTSGELRDALSAAPGSADASSAFWQSGLDAGLKSVRRRADGRTAVGVPPAASVFGGRAPARTAPHRAASRAASPARGLAHRQERLAQGGSRERGARGPASAPAGLPLERRREARDFDGRPGAGSSGRLTRETSVAVSPWSPKERAKPKPAAPPRIPPQLDLADWLGKGALKAPKGKLSPPSFSALKELFPERLPDGRAYRRAAPAPGVVEHVPPPEERADYEAWLEKDRRRGRKKEAHWHQDGKTWVFHAGKAWAAAEGEDWSWFLEGGRRWWTVADGAQRMVRHEGSWWWLTKDGWFLLKGGEPWAWRHFPEWLGSGVIHPTRGTQVVYSADGLRLAVLTPGKETVVLDARTGELLALYPAEKLPYGK